MGMRVVLVVKKLTLWMKGYYVLQKSKHHRYNYNFDYDMRTIEVDPGKIGNRLAVPVLLLNLE